MKINFTKIKNVLLNFKILKNNFTRLWNEFTIEERSGEDEFKTFEKRKWNKGI
jgi:hypothetical protein